MAKEQRGLGYKNNGKAYTFPVKKEFKNHPQVKEAVAANKKRGTSDGHMVSSGMSMSDAMTKGLKGKKHFSDGSDKERKNQTNRHSYYKRQFERGEDKQAL